MLMFAGLLAVLAAGAASFVGFETDPAEEEDPQADGPADGQPAREDGDLPDLVQMAAEDAPTDALTDAPEGDIISGGAGPEAIAGTSGQDQINGYDGADTIRGGAGDDVIHGSGGPDDLAGEAGADTLHGGDGADILRGGAGVDRLFGHNGQDTLYGEAGDDSLVGSAGDDVLSGGAGDDALHGDIGNDSLQGGPGQDTLFGGWGDDVISGMSDDPATAGRDDVDGRDYLNGGGGDDVILAGRDDVVSTGSGSDTIMLGDWLSDENEAEILDFADAEDRLAVLYDDSEGKSPAISFEPDAARDDMQHLVVDGVRIAALLNAGDLTPADVMLVPLSQYGPMTAP